MSHVALKTHTIVLIYRLILQLTNAIQTQRTHWLCSIVCACNLASSIQVHRVFLLFCLPPAGLLYISLACDHVLGQHGHSKRHLSSHRWLRNSSLKSSLTTFITAITSHHPLCQICTCLRGHNCSKGLQSHSQRTDLQYLKNVCSYGFIHRIAEPKMSRVSNL